MSIICPAVLAENSAEYNRQIRVVSEFAERIQIDLMDGVLTGVKSVQLKDVWWPPALTADIHLMYKRPLDYLDALIGLQPSMVIIHAEADVHHMHFAAELHKSNIKAGLAILPETSIDSVGQILHSFDHLMIFSGDLGHFGGKADLDLLSRVKEAKGHHPELEIGWDGGVNDQNARQIADSGVDVLNAGGFIQNSGDPVEAYKKLLAVTGKVE